MGIGIRGRLVKDITLFALAIAEYAQEYRYSNYKKKSLLLEIGKCVYNITQKVVTLRRLDHA